MSTCTATCRGFSTLRPECIADPCLATNMCFAAAGPTGSSAPPNNGQTCAQWCCQSHPMLAAFLILLLCATIFFAAMSYWYRRLHLINVRNDLEVEIKNKKILQQEARSESQSGRGSSRPRP